MRQVTALTSTYSSDVFGICSALYELGGMVVMHDASGCNSTYTTHDEPRWYDMDSMVYISAISEREAILGNDEKLIGDLVETAQRLHPRFIAVVLAPIPYMIGTDAAAIARIVTERCDIPCFGFSANGMHDYTRGVSTALDVIVRAYAREPGEKDRLRVNLLGVTPLDFGVNGSAAALRQWVTDHDMETGTCLAMGCTLDDIAAMPNAQVNLVVSTGGFAAARWMEERFDIPYVVGVPYGRKFSEELAAAVREAALSGKSVIADSSANNFSDGEDSGCVIIGEAVTASSLAAAMERERGLRVRVLCPLETEPELMRPGDLFTPEEDDIIRELTKADAVIADPLYRPLCADKLFYPLPHMAFSGRMYEKKMPNLIGRKLW